MDYCLKEIEGAVWVSGPVIIGAGPSGLAAAAACLKQRGIPSLVLERANCIASLWQNKTYDHLKLHLPKLFCELPFMLFPRDFPTYPNMKQFLTYLETYSNRFGIKPVFNRTVESAWFNQTLHAWRIKTRKTEFVAKWIIVATGENADEFVPKIEGMSEFEGMIHHTSAYKNGDVFRGKKVLIVGCGNSGMEGCLDLCNYNARPAIVVRDSEGDVFSKEGFPRMPFPNGWKGKHGLYAVGFTRRGLSGASSDARTTAEDIEEQWKAENK